jgi:glucosamine 6-phosphate synthetase-like amidotransferase/phosphosugar isomerase protein
MCGIIGYTGARDVTPILLDGLRRLEYRGYDSAGVAIHDPTTGGLRLARCKGKIAGLAEQLAASPLRGTSGIGHTRWATHGRPSSRTPTRTAPAASRRPQRHHREPPELRARLAAAGAPSPARPTPR